MILLYFRSFFIFTFILIGANSSASEVSLNLNFIVTANPIKSPQVKKSTLFSFKETNELKIALMGIIRFYQLFISTQDISVCNFTPSCSDFGMKAIKKYGIFYGILMTSDRLQRCHNMASKYYPLHPITGKASNPVEDSYLWEK
jgi:putative membrane protein insertion efficiency factor